MRACGVGASRVVEVRTRRRISGFGRRSLRAAGCRDGSGGRARPSRTTPTTRCSRLAKKSTAEPGKRGMNPC